MARCAWHPQNHGHGKVLGVTSWRGLRIDFTDGICDTCAARMAAPPRGSTGDPGVETKDGHTSEIVVVALAVMIGLVLVARPTHDAPPPSDIAGALPRALTVAQAPALEQRVPARIRRAHSARHALATRPRAVHGQQSP